MYIKIQPHDPSKDIGGMVNYLDKENQRRGLVEYLDKQNQDLGGRDEKEYFFHTDREDIDKREVIEELCKDHQGLRKNDAKFFMITISPSQDELKHLKGLYGGDKQALKEYTREVMKGYAVCMNREIEGRKLEEKDLRWYGMYENMRKYGRKDHEVLHNREYRKLERSLSGAEEGVKDRMRDLGGPYVVDSQGKVQKRVRQEKGDVRIKEGLRKPGMHAHVHVLVHRKDRAGRISLSPLASSRGGKTSILTRYYKDELRISKAKAMEFSEREGKKLGEGSVEVRKEKVQIGFHRNHFKEYAESAFDHKFDYERKLKHSFEGYNHLKKDLKGYKAIKMGNLTQGVRVARGMGGLTGVKGQLKDHVVDRGLSQGYGIAKTLVSAGVGLTKGLLRPKEMAMSLVSKGIKSAIPAPLRIGLKIVKSLVKEL